MRINLTYGDLDLCRNARRDVPVFVRDIDLDQKGSGFLCCRCADERHGAGTLFASYEQNTGRLQILQLAQGLLRHLDGDGQWRVVNNAPNTTAHLHELSGIEVERFDTTRERRGDISVAQAFLGGCKLRPRRGKSGFGLRHAVSGGNATIQKRSCVVEVPLRAVQFGARARKVRLALLRFKPRNNRTCVNVRPFLDQHLRNLTGRFRTDRRVTIRQRLTF